MLICITVIGMKLYSPRFLLGGGIFAANKKALPGEQSFLGACVIRRLPKT